MARLIAILFLGICGPFAASNALHGEDAATPTFTVVPAASGPQLVRLSVPFPPGFLKENETLMAQTVGGRAASIALRVLSWHPVNPAAVRSARRAIVTFPWQFDGRLPVTFELRHESDSLPPPAPSSFVATVAINADVVQLEGPVIGKVELKLVAPRRAGTDTPRVEVVEDNAHFRWQRVLFPDSQWPRVIETRADSTGSVIVVAHLQRVGADGNFAPTLGWEFNASAPITQLEAEESNRPLGDAPLTHSFQEGRSLTTIFGETLAVDHPTAPLKRRGTIDLANLGQNRSSYRYLRCRAEDQVPMPPCSWQRCEIVLSPHRAPRLTHTLGSPHSVSIAAADWAPVYANLSPRPNLPPEFEPIVRYHREAMVRSAAVGDDFGNVTHFSESSQYGGTFGMNRLNHCAPLFEDAWRANDRQLLTTALDWTNNFYDQSIWWGTNERGGTRYNNIIALQRPAPTPDFMWRSNDSVSFCTKGYDAFWVAWEETGDPRFMEAFQAQITYASEHLHAGAPTCRNVGNVRDFVRLYRYTGEAKYLAEALRLFRELRTTLSDKLLFDEGGKPLDPDPPFIEDDEKGRDIGYAKPYIIGYALAGLPELIAHAPDEPQLKETVRAVANFLAETVDPAGGWRYPHPRSSMVLTSQAMEHAWQLTQAARALGPEPLWLDAIETTLRARILLFKRTGTIYAGLEGWETTTGKCKTRHEVNDLYRKPADRERTRDYTEGKLNFGSAPPEGLVYFSEVLAYYLEHRSPERLLTAPHPDEPLGRILQRAPSRTQ